jgi:hypothetical protein
MQFCSGHCDLEMSTLRVFKRITLIYMQLGSNLIRSLKTSPLYEKLCNMYFVQLCTTNLR